MARKPIAEDAKCIKVSVSFTAEDYQKLMSYCQKEERPIAWVVREAMQDWFVKNGL